MTIHPLFTATCAVMEDQGWEYSVVQAGEVLQTTFATPKGKVRIHIQVFAPIDALSVVAYHPQPCPPSHFAAIAELLMRRNLIIAIGNFELEYKKGGILFRLSNIFGSSPAEHGIIHGIIQSALGEMHGFAPSLGQLLATPTEQLPAVPLEALASASQTAELSA